MISLKNIDINYSDFHLKINEINFNAETFNLIKGRSGCGKSTLLNRVGLISLSSDYYVNGKLLNIKEKQEFKANNIAFVLQEPMMFETYTILENFELFSRIANKIIDISFLKDLMEIMALEIDLNQKVCTLSIGEKKRFAIICSLCKKPSVLILDEPTSALDKQNEEKIYYFLKRIAINYKICIIVASHSEIAEKYANQIYDLEKNRYLLTSESKREILYNTEKYSYFSFPYFFYLKSYFNKYKIINLLTVIIVLLGLLLSVMINSYVCSKFEENLTTIQKLSDNQIYVTNNKNSKYIENAAYKLTNTDYDYLKETKNLLSVYPYIDCTLIVNGDLYDVFPYFDENDFTNKLKFSVYSQGNMLVDSKLYNMIFISNIQTGTLVFPSCESREIKLHIKGVLKNNIKSAYNPEAKNYVFLSYDLIEKMYNETSVDNGYIGYTLFMNDYSNIMPSLRHLSFKYKVNLDFADITAIDSIVKMNHYIEIALVFIIWFVVYIFIITITIYYLNKRKLEFTLLKLSGARSQNIILFSCIDFIGKLFVSITLFTLVFSVFKLLGIELINLKKILGFSFTALILLVFIVILSIIRFTNAIDEENVLRKIEK